MSIAGQNVSMRLQNTGALDGAEVVQLYLLFPSSAGEPPQQLKGFEKTFLKAGASADITFVLEDKDFSIWNQTTHGWSKVTGTFGVRVGASSRDIRLTGSMTPHV